MKKLYKATQIREFCFVYYKSLGTSPDAVAKSLVDQLDDDGEVVDVFDIETTDEIPDGWANKVPLGTSDEELDCDEFVLKHNWASRIIKRMKDDGFFIEDDFAEALIQAMIDEGDKQTKAQKVI